MDKKLIVITGPTACGKTALSVALAKELGCPILSADSRQFYKELSIGTAKPSKEEMMGVTHYFVDSHSIHTPITSGQFEKEAIELLENLYQTHDQVILTGGSGMFLKALTHGTDQLPHNEKIRAKWNAIYEKEGIDTLKNKVKELDAEALENLDINNPVRLIRVLELMEITGEKISKLRKNKTAKRNFESIYFIIDHDRKALYERINKRVDQMIHNGLIQETKAVKEFMHLQPLNTVGYKEIFDFLDGQHDRESAIELIKRNTRRYAKRQLTWFRGMENAYWVEFDTLEKMKSIILNQLND